MLLGLILIVLTLLGCGLFVAQPVWFPVSISAEALAFDRQFSRTLWIAGILFTCAQLLLAWTLLRRKKSAAAPHPRWEMGAAVAATVLFLSLALFGSRGWAKIPTRSPGEETIEVYAHQFHFWFRYPGADGYFGRTENKFISDSEGNPMGVDRSDPSAKDDLIASSLRVPAGRDVLLLLHSRDVIHDFFVRELRTKQDIVPGMEIPLEIRVDQPGEYEIACAELCGAGHSQMRSLLIVMPGADYDRWKAQAATAR